MNKKYATEYFSSTGAMIDWCNKHQECRIISAISREKFEFMVFYYTESNE